MKIVVKSPIKAYVEASEEELMELKRQLTYTNTGVQHQLKRHSSAHFWRSKNPEAWETRKIELQKELKKTLVFSDDEGVYIRPGSVAHLFNLNFTVENQIQYPTPKRIPWQRPLPFDLHPYQLSTVEKFLKTLHANASLTTASGKSAIILKLCRELGLKTAIVAPSKAIFRELKEKLEHHFGKGKIGSFGNNQKKLDRLITICIGDSIANVKPGSPEHDFFKSLDVLIVDESHTFAADSLEKICHDVLGNIPYRFFLSATQVRGDGTLALLQSIIGPTVETLTTAEAVKSGYICPHEFKIVQINSSNPSFQSQDALQMKREHFLRNTNIANFSAKLANSMASRGQQTLILVEELNQIAMITKLLKVPYVIAHSEGGKERLLEVGLEKVDIQDNIEKFNKNEAKVFIGTSCIRTGVNIYPCHHTVNWVGGASEISTKQGCVGRSVRFLASNPWAANCVQKDFATIWDFDVQDNYTMQRHLEARLGFYKESEAPIQYVAFT